MPAHRITNKIRWSSDVAYAVGLITTDGNLSSDGRHIILTSTDKQLLKTFAYCLNKKNKISINPPSSIGRKIAYHIQIGDTTLYEWLQKLGITQRKSLTIGELQIPKKFLRDFVRGHLDGDGSIVHYIDKYNTYLNSRYVYDRLFVFLMSCSKNHIEWLREKIQEDQGLHGSFLIQRSKYQLGKSFSYRIKFSTKEAKKLLNWIYYRNNLPKLERKFKIAQPFLRVSN
ncbi:MAG TPA: LAGLIDADG family homing endonuclease [Patescibacteria group bacterium]